MLSNARCFPFYLLPLYTFLTLRLEAHSSRDIHIANVITSFNRLR